MQIRSEFILKSEQNRNNIEEENFIQESPPLLFISRHCIKIEQQQQQQQQ